MAGGVEPRPTRTGPKRCRSRTLASFVRFPPRANPFSASESVSKIGQRFIDDFKGGVDASAACPKSDEGATQKIRGPAKPAGGGLRSTRGCNWLVVCVRSGGGVVAVRGGRGASRLRTGGGPRARQRAGCAPCRAEHERPDGRRGRTRRLVATSLSKSDNAHFGPLACEYIEETSVRFRTQILAAEGASSVRIVVVSALHGVRDEKEQVGRIDTLVTRPLSCGRRRPLTRPREIGSH